MIPHKINQLVADVQLGLVGGDCGMFPDADIKLLFLLLPVTCPRAVHQLI